ncbi:Possible biotin--acetyl-CoA-carboxylase ligase (BirA bifunctional protein) [Mycobacteroides abscessus]|uniref:biotin--[acetyl-CoA-carboxylase] ligase n=1 Tax=Mycobacteroides abscessus TaxID=36809 RepID=UPI0005E5AAEE|nr:biotin--[acetyl-CoA-carboxylase] ligase [Mycobacteroides abscessus]CPX04635.1 Possible biotin--acetyl-CoA-carboxylase ligase (BirA bifunctional protein) [Mycobacteroides abscessus]
MTSDRLTLTDSPGGHWRRIDVVEETGSTNADLVARAAAGEDIDGVVLLAEHQSAGRGRHGRSWGAPAHTQLSMSVGIGVGEVPPDRWGLVPLLAGVAIVDAVAEVSGIQAGLKWPNDVLVDGRKLCGILAEVATPHQAIVLGLGLNATIAQHELPDPNATSLTILGWADPDRDELARAVLRELGGRIEHWRAARGVDERLLEDYRGRSVTLGSRVRAELPGERELVGVAVGLGNDGQLRIEAADGTVTVVTAGDITHLRPLGDQ